MVPTIAEKPGPKRFDEELKGVEIFRAGTYTIERPDGSKEVLTYSEADVQELADNTNKLISEGKHEPPAKLGHDDDQKFARMAGLPSVGWLKSLTARGGRLFADFTKVPDVVAEAIRKGRYRHISSEIYDAAQTAENFGDAVVGLSLRAAALLGADIPVVKGMNALMLAAGTSDKFQAIAIPKEETPLKLADDGKKPLMVPANRHPYGALVKMEGSEDAHRVHNIHPDGTYDVHALHDDGKIHKAVQHDDLTLMSEREYKAAIAAKETEDMDAKKLADTQAQLLAEQQKTKALENKMRDERLGTFAEKHKAILTPARKPAFEALAKMEVSAPVKLAEGKEVSFLDAFLAFAESTFAAKPVLFGELAIAGKEGVKMDEAEIKLAEAPFKAYAAQNHVGITGADRAVAARAYAEEHKVPYKAALLKVAALSQAQGEVA